MGKAPAYFSDWKPTESGYSANATPQIGADNYTIYLTVIWEARRLAEIHSRGQGESDNRPVIREQVAATSIVLHDGEAAAFHLSSSAIPEDDPTAQIRVEAIPEALLIAVRIVDASGKPIRPRRRELGQSLPSKGSVPQRK